jgi:hypothetical protein
VTDKLTAIAKTADLIDIIFIVAPLVLDSFDWISRKKA